LVSFASYILVARRRDNLVFPLLSACGLRCRDIQGRRLVLDLPFALPVTVNGNVRVGATVLACNGMVALPASGSYHMLTI
jgi:hypothetical protein